MAEQPRDWDRELANIDKIIATGPPTAAPTSSPAPRAAGPSAGGPTAATRAPGGKAAIAGTWFRAVLAAALVAALVVWPFAKLCGAGLALYLGAVGLSIITSLWAVAASWTHRRGFAHVIGLLTLGASLVLAAAEVLPRIGYAHVTATWLCTDAVPPAATPASTP